MIRGLGEDNSGTLEPFNIVMHFQQIADMREVRRNFGPIAVRLAGADDAGRRAFRTGPISFNRRGAASMIGNYAFGIEEEFFLSSAETRRPVPRLPKRFHADLASALHGSLRREMLQSQIETATPPLYDMSEAADVLRGQRQPLARWDAQRASPRRRYQVLMDSLQMLGSRNILCGLHVHVSVPEPADRVDLMRRVIPFLPLFLALSTSSPYWQGRRTGLMGYRLAAYDELPRTGLPELFRDETEYRRYVDGLVLSGAIPDESYIWWAVRPSSKYPTLELRIADSCTSTDHAVAIAALYRCLVRHLVESPALNRDIGAVERAVALENKWIAQRHGIRGAFIDAASHSLRPVPELIEDLLAMLEGDADALDCRSELGGVRAILQEGTSACRQVAREQVALARGLSPAEALTDVVDWLALATAGHAEAHARTLH
jgi:glutamate---cysteine ligase / carboxylate-amine ligase